MSGCRIARVRMKAGGADVRVLHQPQTRATDIAACMRALATQIERGEVDAYTAITVVVTPGAVKTYAWGEEGEHRVNVLGFLQMATAHVSRELLAEIDGA